MPRSRGSEMNQRQSPRVPLHLRTTAASEANSLHRPSADRSSPKPDDHRSPRGGPLPEKKRGATRVADLEAKLGQMQEELKKVKEQLASAEAARQELEEAEKQSGGVAAPSLSAPEEENRPPSEEPETQHQDPQEKADHPLEHGLPEPVPSPAEPPATDVFEVVPPATIPAKTQGGNEHDNGEGGVVEKAEEEDWTMIQVDGTNGTKAQPQEEARGEPAEFSEDPEISELRAKLAVKEEELELQSAENESLKKQAAEAAADAVAARAKEEELGVKLRSVQDELREDKAQAGVLGEQLGAAEAARAALEAEMKRLKVQSEQWRKAAEAAAAVLASGEGMGTEASGRRVAERCGSMDKHLGGYGTGWSPLMGGEEMDEEGQSGGGKRKGGGIRMFGDLWRKKGQQQGKN